MHIQKFFIIFSLLFSMHSFQAATMYNALHRAEAACVHCCFKTANACCLCVILGCLHQYFDELSDSLCEGSYNLAEELLKNSPYDAHRLGLKFAKNDTRVAVGMMY